MSNTPRLYKKVSHRQTPQQNAVVNEPITDALINQAMAGANQENWKDIKPLRTYTDIKKKAFIDQKKREYGQMKKDQQQITGERQTMPYKQQNQRYPQNSGNFDNKRQRVSNKVAAEAYHKAKELARQKQEAIARNQDTNKMVAEPTEEELLGEKKHNLMTELRVRKENVKKMTPEERRNYYQQQKRGVLEDYMKQVVDVIGKQGFQVYRTGIIRFRKQYMQKTDLDRDKKLVYYLVDSLILAVFRTYIDKPLSLIHLGLSEDAFDQKKQLLGESAQHLIVPRSSQAIEAQKMHMLHTYYHELIEEFSEKCLSIDSKLKYLRQQQMGLKDTRPKIPSDAKCCICFEESNLFVTKCNHYGCQDCLLTWLTKYLECPNCRQRLRKNQIQKIY